MKGMYALHVRTGKEERIEAALTDAGFAAFVPREERLWRRRGAWIRDWRALMPGYVFVQAELTDAAYYAMTGVQGVLRLLGREPLREDEARLVRRMTEMQAPPRAQRGEDGAYTLLDGPLAGRVGELVRRDRRKRRVTLRLKLFGQVEMQVSAVLAG